MRVLLNTPHLDIPGGVANYYYVLRRHLSNEVDYLTIGSRPGGGSLWGSVVRFVRDYLLFFRKLKAGRYHLAHINTSLDYRAIIRDGIFVLIAKVFHVKVIVFIHGWNNDCARLIRRCFLPVFRLVYFRADAFIVLASQFKRKLIEMGCPEPIFTHTTLVDDEIFNLQTRSKGFEKPKSEQRVVNILFLSRLEKAKGVYEAVDAYKMLKTLRSDISLTIAGDGSELCRIRKYASRQAVGDITFPGYVRGEAKHDLFSGADVFFFPTTYGEGMPTTIVEAMAYGLPIVTRPVGGMRDVLQNGVTGFLTESTDSDVFAKLLERLVADGELRSRISAFNRKYAREHFKASIVAKRLEQIYRMVLWHGAEH